MSEFLSQRFVKKKQTSGGTSYALFPELTESQQWGTAYSICDGLNGLYEQIYNSKPSRGNMARPKRDSDEKVIIFVVVGKRLQLRLRGDQVLFHRSHQPLDVDPTDSVSQRIMSIIQGAEVREDGVELT